MRWILLAYILTSVITFLVYGLDKRAAVRGRGRTPEATLHLLELLWLLSFSAGLSMPSLRMNEREKIESPSRALGLKVSHSLRTPESSGSDGKNGLSATPLSGSADQLPQIRSRLRS